MTIFGAKAIPTDEKLRGGYYTPAPIAAFVAEWVGVAGNRLLEPSCGDGNILEALTRLSDDVHGVELFPDEAAMAMARTGVDVVVGDFFEWFDDEKHGVFDGVAGNPPYIRFGNWSEPTRSDALDFMRSVGLSPNKLTNAWVPFVVASMVACREGGRIGLVIPAELMQVGYAAELRRYLIDNCAEVNVVTFKRLVFPGILQEVVLLLAVKGSGPARIQVVEIDDAASLGDLEIGTAHVRAPLHEKEKWTKYFLEPERVTAVRALRADARLRPMAAFASVDVGVVTGRNSFFVMTPDEADEHRVSNLTIPLVARSAQLSGIVYTDQDHRTAVGRTALLDARGVHLGKHIGLREYVSLGESQGVHSGYKCRIRKEWWVVPSIWEADAFMFRQIHTHPRVVANETTATSTDTVHRMRMVDGVSAARLATASFNSITFAMSEVVGRSYGGGILELEPSEAEELRVPDPELVTDDLVQKVDELVRAKRIEDALDAVDRAVLIDGLDFTLQEVSIAREVWATLRDRRNGRAKSRVV
ncbi:Eco57I restriction-modification methylase domain-containing protein [Nakamurella leprariae]|uniref:site-specific DNA-methyltransferase (adenine-specific) n=1 Tax=Nakamurella leprariae TaxID=2803911 RepID=A0A938YD98_9ACTN|nr:class I SAM-dependent methyltransferase [Nakamurella leprariae]MBM9467466.1 class I SAM-dependent methyltransferase [Nakamurella leprariae]